MEAALEAVPDTRLEEAVGGYLRARTTINQENNNYSGETQRMRAHRHRREVNGNSVGSSSSSSSSSISSSLSHLYLPQ